MKMAIRQLLYISQDHSTQTIDLPIEIQSNFNVFTVGELKRLIIKNELKLHSNKSQSNRSSLFIVGHRRQFENTQTLYLCDEMVDNFRLILCNKELQDSDQLHKLNFNHIFNFKVRIVGGKGGFGATFRSQKPKHPMTMNFDACRDLSGRRLRHVNAQQQLEQWNKERQEEEKKIEEEMKDFKEQEQKMKAAIHANTYKIDQKYKAQLESSATNIANSVVLGKSRLKRKHKDLMQLHRDDEGVTFREKDVGNLGENTLTSNIKKEEMDDFDDMEDQFFQTNNRKLKRFKVDETEEQEFKDDVQQDQEEPSLMVKPQDEPEPQKEEQKEEEVKVETPQLEATQDTPMEQAKESPSEIPEAPQQNPEVSMKAIFDTLEKATSVEDLRKYYSTEQIKDNLNVLG